MPLALLLFTATVLVLTANLLAKNQNDRQLRWYDWLLFSLNMPLLAAGPVVAIVPRAQLALMAASTGIQLQNQGAFGLTLLAMAAWGALVSWRQVRQFLARWLPLTPSSPVHALALVMSGYLAGSTLLTLTQGGLESLVATAVAADITSILSQFFLFVLLALLGVGLFTRRDAHAVNQRLGLARPTRHQVSTGLRWIAVLVVLQWLFGAISALINPAQLELLDDISGALLGDIDTIWEWLILALATGIGEELLFRGALQPALGLKFTSVLFAISHVQYGITPITLAIAIMGFALGHIRRENSTTIAIIVHSGYNLVLGLLALMAAQFAG